MVNDTLAIAATFTAEPIEPTLTFWIEQLGLKATIEFAPYGQTFQSLLDPGSAIGRNQRGLNVVLVRMEDWRPSASGGRRFDEVWSDPASTLTRGVDELVDALRTAAARRATSFFVCVCPPSVRFATDGTIAPLLRDAEARLAAAFAHHTGVSVLSSASLLATYPVSDYDDPHGEEIGHVPYTPAMFAAIATGIARRFFAVKTAAGRKVIAVDCDDTLWEGICGEVGPDGVVIDAARTALQAFLVEQQQHGMLICLCSKNNPADVHAVFDTREMPLARRHIVAERINWQPKSANIRELAAELQLGLDSFVFLDDSPVECAEVRASCPEVLTLQLPQPATTLPDFLAHSWAFDRLHAGTAEDQRRTDMYRENVERETLRRQASTLADFLASLDLRVRIAPPSPGELPRVAQLTERTNQFNASTIRRSEREIAELCADGYVPLPGGPRRRSIWRVRPGRRRALRRGRRGSRCRHVPFELPSAGPRRGAPHPRGARGDRGAARPWPGRNSRHHHRPEPSDARIPRPRWQRRASGDPGRVPLPVLGGWRAGPCRACARCRRGDGRLD